MRKKLSQLSDRLESYRNKQVLKSPTAYIDNRRIELDRSRDRLIRAQEQILNRSKQQFISLTAALEAMSPLKVLIRGYAIASDSEGKCVKSISELAVDDRLCLTFSDGSAGCIVQSIEKN